MKLLEEFISEILEEQKEDPEFANLRKKIASRKKQVRANFNKIEKQFVVAAAELVVAEIGWDSGLEELIEIFQDDPANIKKAFKNFDRAANDSAGGLFQDDAEVVALAMPSEEAIFKMIKKVKI